MFSDESLYAKLQMHCRLKTEKPFSGLITNDAPSLPFRWAENVYIEKRCKRSSKGDD